MSRSGNEGSCLLVTLSVYDVTNTDNAEANALISWLNGVTDSNQLGLGVFHGGLVVAGAEWSFGFCESGTGVYSCSPQQNPMYKFRRIIDLGPTPKSKEEVKAILRRLRDEWRGSSYDLLTRNCCHFCEEFAQALECKPPPAWLNRLAKGADATITFTNNTVQLARDIGSNVSTAAFWLRDSLSTLLAAPRDSDGEPMIAYNCSGEPASGPGSLFFPLLPSQVDGTGPAAPAPPDRPTSPPRPLSMSAQPDSRSSGSGRDDDIAPRRLTGSSDAGSKDGPAGRLSGFSSPKLRPVRPSLSSESGQRTGDGVEDASAAPNGSSSTLSPLAGMPQRTAGNVAALAANSIRPLARPDTRLPWSPVPARRDADGEHDEVGGLRRAAKLAPEEGLVA